MSERQLGQKSFADDLVAEAAGANAMLEQTGRLVEDALTDRLSFRRFIGLGLSEQVPDHSTLWRFREQLATSGLVEKAFALVTGQIENSGFVLKQGTLIDASLIRSAVNPPAPPDGPLPWDADGRPASKLVKSALDPDAGWTKQQNKRVFGYKAHVAMDQGSRIIRRAMLTPANVNESVPADALICGDEKVVYADRPMIKTPGEAA